MDHIEISRKQDHSFTVPVQLSVIGNGEWYQSNVNEVQGIYLTDTFPISPNINGEHATPTPTLQVYLIPLWIVMCMNYVYMSPSVFWCPALTCGSWHDILQEWIISILVSQRLIIFVSWWQNATWMGKSRFSHVWWVSLASLPILIQIVYIHWLQPLKWIYIYGTLNHWDIDSDWGG